MKKFVERVNNESFEEQMKIQKRLTTPMGDQSEYESDADFDSGRESALDSPIITSTNKG